MEDVVRGPVELIDADLDEVAGGHHRDVTVNNVGVGAEFGGILNENSVSVKIIVLILV